MAEASTISAYVIGHNAILSRSDWGSNFNQWRQTAAGTLRPHSLHIQKTLSTRIDKQTQEWAYMRNWLFFVFLNVRP